MSGQGNEQVTYQTNPETAELYASASLDIVYCWPDLELGRRVEADDLTEQGVAYRRLDAQWYRWLHERAMKARKAGHALPEFDRIRAWAVAHHGQARVAQAEAMTLPVGYRKPEVRR